MSHAGKFRSSTYAAARPVSADALEAARQGMALAERFEWPRALVFFDRAVELAPHWGRACLLRAQVLRDLGQDEAALQSLDRAQHLNVQERVDHAFLRAGQLKRLHRFSEAMQAYELVLSLDANHAGANFGKGLMYLLQGDWRKGWPLYEWRWKAQGRTASATLPSLDTLQPPADGLAAWAGRRIWLPHEQGYGDTLMCCRFVPQLAEMGLEVHMQVQEPLRKLLQGLPGVHHWYDSHSTPPKHDVCCPQLSLPWLFNLSPDTVPLAAGYLQADAAHVARWQARLPARAPGQRRVGLVCSGSPTHVNDGRRSLSMRELLAAVPATMQRVCLQKDVRDADREALREPPQVLCFEASLTNFSQTAALIACLDVVVTVDTSVAHLAGALGKPTLVLLPWVPDWRWMLGRSDTPWYDSVRLLRQARPDDWSQALAQLTHALNAQDVLLGAGDMLPPVSRLAAPSSATAPENRAQTAALRAAILKAQDAFLQEQYPAVQEALRSWLVLDLPSVPSTLRVQMQRLWGGAAFHLGQPQQTAQAFAQVVHSHHAVAQDWLSYASALDETRQVDAALQAYGRAMELKPDWTVARLQWCALLRSLGRQSEVQTMLEHALQALPESAPTHERALLVHGLGVVHQELNGRRAAQPFLQEALRLDPDFHEVRFHLGMQALSEGDHARGWAGFEWRWGQSQAKNAWRRFGLGPPSIAQLKACTQVYAPEAGTLESGFLQSELIPCDVKLGGPLPTGFAQLWRGQALGEASLLVWEEQGLGDTIQFFRYMALLRQREPCATLLFWCRDTLHPILQNWAKAHRVQLLSASAIRPEQVQGQEWHVPLMSLPWCMQVLNFPPTAGTVQVPQEAEQRWAGRIARYRAMKKRPQVGLVWSGMQATGVQNRRNLDLKCLLPLKTSVDVQWHSMQVGVVAGDIALSAWQGNIVDWSHHLKDFGETAGLVRQLDLVIAVDTSCAHLAGSLGVPTWVLSRFDACWRWLNNYENSPWYPSIRIFRQPQPQNWDALVETLTDSLPQVFNEFR
jgi:tetratricopeptide (TPR) repeat protein